MKTRNYVVSSRPIISSFYETSYRILRDLPEGVEPPIQMSYLNEVVGLFLRTFVKIYESGDFSDEDRAKLVRYLNRIFEAKDAATGKEPKDGFYKREQESQKAGKQDGKMTRE